jgi:uncharacterized protein (DUF433 family)
MAMSAEPEPHTEAIDPVGHIVRTPGVTGGRPRIAGTRIRVSDIAVSHLLHGNSPEQIATQVYPWLSPGDVHAALAYYHDHRDEIEAQDQEDEEFAERFLADHPEIASRFEG